MIAYASNTGTIRNLSVLKKHGWRIMTVPGDHNKLPEGFKYAIDNGAWIAHQNKLPFDADAFLELVDRRAGAADFVVVPDIVCGGMDSLEFSVSWLSRLRMVRHLLLPLQDGMEASKVESVLRTWPSLGLFLGGSTEFKLNTMLAWGMVAHAFGRWYHVGRVNTARRIWMCEHAGADSFDGTSASRYSCNTPKLEDARRQQSLFRPAPRKVG